MTALLDGNALVALAVADHVHHGPVRTWFGAGHRTFVTTPITQGTLLRLLVRNDVSAADALTVLDGITGHDDHQFWPDDVPYSSQALRGVIDHRQVTDGYLADLARRRDARLVTLDRGLAVAHGDVVDLVET
jgi:uncharacterized protein